jgi:hypothetical protein
MPFHRICMFLCSSFYFAVSLISPLYYCMFNNYCAECLSFYTGTFNITNLKTDTPQPSRYCFACMTHRPLLSWAVAACLGTLIFWYWNQFVCILMHFAFIVAFSVCWIQIHWCIFDYVFSKWILISSHYFPSPFNQNDCLKMLIVKYI